MSELMTRHERTYWEWVGRRERLGYYTPTPEERPKINLAEELKRGERNARRMHEHASRRRHLPLEPTPRRPPSTYGLSPETLMRYGNHLCQNEGWTPGEFQIRHDVPPPNN